MPQAIEQIFGVWYLVVKRDIAAETRTSFTSLHQSHGSDRNGYPCTRIGGYPFQYPLPGYPGGT